MYLFITALHINIDLFSFSHFGFDTVALETFAVDFSLPLFINEPKDNINKKKEKVISQTWAPPRETQFFGGKAVRSEATKTSSGESFERAAFILVKVSLLRFDMTSRQCHKSTSHNIMTRDSEWSHHRDMWLECIPVSLGKTLHRLCSLSPFKGWGWGGKGGAAIEESMIGLLAEVRQYKSSRLNLC